jgi:hypothetical protein
MDEEKKDARWFHEHKRLAYGIVDVTKLTEVDVTQKEISSFFGPKSGKNGWKYASYTTPEAAQSILSLYRRIYLTARIPNNELTLQFARGLVLQSRGAQVDWANFAASTEARRAQIRSTKLANRKGDGDEGCEGREGLLGQDSSSGRVERLVVVGRRHFASLPENVPLPTLNLVKIEGQGEMSLVKKEGRGTDKRVVLSPHWAPDDLTNMASVLEFHKTCLSSLSLDFENVSQEKSILKGEIRRT